MSYAHSDQQILTRRRCNPRRLVDSRLVPFSADTHYTNFGGVCDRVQVQIIRQIYVSIGIDDDEKAAGEVPCEL